MSSASLRSVLDALLSLCGSVKGAFEPVEDLHPPILSQNTSFLVFVLPSLRDTNAEVFCSNSLTMTETIPPLTTSTNLGPMITPISFPGDCLSSLYDFNTLGLGLPWTYQTQGCALSTCCPYGNYYTEGYAWLTSYYSPAVCPVSYKKCPLPTKLASLSSGGGESIALCCPYGKFSTIPIN